MNKETVTRYFRNPPEIETPRLLLRRMLKTDYLDMFAYAKDSEVTKYLLWDPHPTPQYTLRYLNFIQQKYRSGEFFDWAVIWRETNTMIGTCGFTTFQYPHKCGEVGYVLNRDFWGMGIAPEAVRAVLHVGFSELDLHRIEAKFMKGNEQSLRVMEKCGMTFEGYNRDSMLVKGEFKTIGRAAILKHEYFNNK